MVREASYSFLAPRFPSAAACLDLTLRHLERDAPTDRPGPVQVHQRRPYRKPVAGRPRDSLASPPSRHLRPQPFPLPPVPHHPTVVGLTDVGQIRSRNEDSLTLVPNLGVAVVADGMGGHPGGDVASRIAAETAAKALEEELRDGAAGAADPAERLEEAMLRSVLLAHEAIRVEGQNDPELVGMGTTITALAADPQTDFFVLGHVGDSRGYRFRDGELTQLTRDDTWVQERIDAEQLTVAQGKRHPFAHLLTQCLGLEDTPVPHITHGTVEVGDTYLLCSDGLVGMLDDPKVLEILSRELAVNGAAREQRVVQALIDAANAAGGYDNITAVLMTIGAAGDP